MDTWIVDDLKEAFAGPAMQFTERLARRLNDRIRREAPIDEPALTEDLVDAFDSNSSTSPRTTSTTASSSKRWSTASIE